MEILLNSSGSRQSRRWGSISLIEQVSKLKEDFVQPTRTIKFKKRLQTDFFPNREVPRHKSKVWSHKNFKKSSYIKTTLEMIKLSVIIIESVLIPYILTFLPNSAETYQYALQFLETIFIFDIFLKFKSQSFIKGLRTENRIQIAKIYLKTDFPLDLICLFPFSFIVPNSFIESEYLYIPLNPENLAKLLWLIKMFRLRYTKDLIYSIEDVFVGSVLLETIKALKFLFTIFLWTHWLACIVYTTFARCLEIEPILLLSYKEDINDRYIRNFYLIIQTMTSVGYGDTLPRTELQHMIAIFSMLFACMLFGNIIGTFQNYIENFDSENKYYDLVIRRLKNLLNKKDFPEYFKNRVVKYIYFIQQINQKNDPKNMDILENLSIPLKEEIFIITRGQLLAKSVVFNLYSGNFLKFLGHQMKIEISAPGDQIFKEGEKTNTIYFINCGRVQIYHEKTKTVFKDLRNMKYFGEISFFLNRPRTASAMCLAFAELLTLDRTTLFNVLQSRPKEKEITNAVLYQVEKYKNLSFIGIKCYLCRRLGHVAKDCKEFVFQVDKADIVSKAEASKYASQINLNEKVQSGTRKKNSSDTLLRFGLVNTKGFRFTPGTMYVDNKGIIEKAYMQDDRIQSTLFQSFCSIKDSVESEGSVSQNVDNNFVTFGNY